MDLYYRGFDPSSPVTSGGKHLAACAARFAVSMIRSIQYLDDAVKAAFLKVVTIENIWALCLIFAGWMIASIIGGPVGAAVNAILLYLGVREFYDRIQEIYHPLSQWFELAYNAKDDKDMDNAARSFATGMANGGMTILEYVILHKLFKVTEKNLLSKFGPPAWLREIWNRTLGRRTKALPGKAEPKPPDKDKAGSAVPIIAGSLQAAGARRAAAEFPTGAVVVGGLLAAVGVTATIAVVATSGGKKR